jgi:hypothetical protein
MAIMRNCYFTFNDKNTGDKIKHLYNTMLGLYYYDYITNILSNKKHTMSNYEYKQFEDIREQISKRLIDDWIKSKVITKNGFDLTKHNEYEDEDEVIRTNLKDELCDYIISYTKYQFNNLNENYIYTGIVENIITRIYSKFNKIFKTIFYNMFTKIYSVLNIFVNFTYKTIKYENSTYHIIGLHLNKVSANDYTFYCIIPNNKFIHITKEEDFQNLIIKYPEINNTLKPFIYTDNNSFKGGFNMSQIINMLIIFVLIVIIIVAIVIVVKINYISFNNE